MSKAESPRILVAEDEPDMMQLIKMNLTGAGFRVIEAEDGPAALTAAREDKPSLMVLDLMLPGMSGLEVCRALKREPATASLPIIMLTARAEEVDRIVGFELGADDYITKPFSPRELVLRVQSILRRAKPATSAVSSEETELKLGVIAIDRARCEVHVKQKRIDLTATELKLLTTLIERRGRVQSRDALLNDVWGYESIIDTRTVDTHIRRLREKLGSVADYIETVRGFGYRMVEPV
jgi:two-component system phosphate regulon response regulator PhoB